MIQLSDATVIVNNEAVGIVPNSLSFTEGLGEQNVRAVSIGGGKTEQVFARNVETNFSTVKFELPTTPENVALARAWKTLGNGNVVQIAGVTAEGTLTRTFVQAALTGDYEVNIGTEANVEIEFKASTAI
jgi:hypothetical protein